MSSKRFSPTAKLLRNSRLFSLPPVLARPAESNGLPPDAIESTSPYPLQQAITTPGSSLARGDWGLKRSLPGKKLNKTSKPIIRVNALDTIEHITDFQSAADLALTLLKVQELALPISTRAIRQRASIFAEVKSVFEPETDHTDPKAAERNTANRRWKFQGPWLAGMSEGDFVRYVAKELRGRKAEFAAFLREHHAQALERSNAQESQDNEDGTTPIAAAKTEEQSFARWMKQLRHNISPASELSRIIARFLDLPESSATTAGLDHLSNYAQTMSDEGPPKTHPSAGLSYLKTNATLTNHPLLGPQASSTPVEARILRARSNQIRDPAGRLGVAGLVVSDGLVNRQRVSTTFDEDIDVKMENRERQGVTVGVATPGGNRIWVHPVRASIDESGRAQLVANSASRTAVGVHTGVLMAPQVFMQPSSDIRKKHLEILNSPRDREKGDSTDDLVSELGRILHSDNDNVKG